MKLKFAPLYLIVTIVLLTTEILIALYLNTGFIRHTFGDYLVVILIYCFFKSFFEIDSYKLAFYVLAFAFIIEFSQLLNILKVLNPYNNKLITIILGSTYQTTDLIAYSLGIISILIIEKYYIQT